MSSFEQAAERHRQAAEYSGYRGGDFSDSLFVEVPDKALPKDKTFKIKLCPPVPGKFDEVPLVFARHRIEVVRTPQVEKPKDKKVAERIGFQTVNEMVLSHLSYPMDHEDIPQVLKTLLEASKKMGLLVDEKGFQHRNKAVQQALAGLVPWTQNLIPCLVQGTKRKIGERPSGDRVYTDYTIDPHNDPDYTKWQPTVLNFENKNLMKMFFERGGQFLNSLPSGPQGQRPSMWSRKGGGIMILKTGRTYDLTFVNNRIGEVPQDLWKSLIDGMPDYAKRLVNARKTDDEIMDLMERSWYWSIVTQTHPWIKDIFPSAGEAQDWSLSGDGATTESEVQPAAEIFEDEHGNLTDAAGNPVDEYGYPIASEGYDGGYYDDEGVEQEAAYEA